MQSVLLSGTVKGGGTEKGVCPLGWGVRGCVFHWGAKEGVWNVHFHPLFKTGGKQHVDGSWYHVLLSQPAVCRRGGRGRGKEKGLGEREERKREEEEGRRKREKGGREQKGREGRQREEKR